MDRVSLRGMKAETLIGAYGWERGYMQTLLLDLDISVSEKVALSSDIGETAHYGDVCEAVRANLHEQGFFLLEVLAEYVADLTLRDFGALQVRVRIMKPGILSDAEEVGAGIERGAPR